ADFAYEWLNGIPAALSLKPGKFQLSVAQNRGAPHKTAGANSKLDKTWGQGQSLRKRTFNWSVAAADLKAHCI
ncbi:hypothetical protein, partial [Brucella anthropi]|uniref:hypothetical protein n=1 Tax=Brucella anthropi TaxID=529 RepID=UPI001AEBD105